MLSLIHICRVRAAVARVNASIERSGITRWDLDDLPEEVRSTGADGHDVVGYPALLDEGESVAVKVFSRPEIAARIHPSGLRRLVLLNVTVGVRGLEKEVPNAVRLALTAVDAMSLGGLLRDVIGAAANRVVADQTDAVGDVRDAVAFDALLDRARRDLRPIASRALRDAGEVLLAASAVAARLDRMEAAPLDGVAGEHLAASLADARAQFGRLVRPGFVASSGTERLSDVARYLRALERRLDKLPESPRRDQLDLVEVAAVERYYRQLLDALTASQTTPKVVETGWLLEELRVAVFAQSIGAKGSVSPKKLRKRIDDLFAGNLD